MELVLSHLVAFAIGIACTLLSTNGGSGWLETHKPMGGGNG